MTPNRAHPRDDALAELARTTPTNTPSDLTDTSTHVASCAACRARLADFERLYAAVRRAPRSVEPPEDLWPALRARLAATAVEQPPAPPPSHSVTRHLLGRRTLGALAAATLLIATTATLARGPRHVVEPVATADSSTPASAPDGADVQSEAVERQLLSDLELQRGRMRPETAAEVDANLRVIDTAISELQAALAQEPGNGVVRELLADSHARKAELLRQSQNAS
jgi:hypothetical protein